MVPLEIERKFLVREGWSIPEGSTRVVIRQAYLTDAESNVEVRLRAKDDAFLMTVKAPRSDGGPSVNVRQEVEFPVPQTVFDQLWELAPDRLDKERWTVALDAAGTTASVDVYTGVLAGLRVVEIEFDDVEQARDFIVPDWFGEDVTGRAEWGNRQLSRGVPPVVDPVAGTTSAPPAVRD
ncbi:CYTH domain-containing protein [Streptomyces sp. NPDC048629]|uniref:CYTH domain-containing protein n=1 Tax=Streptomyces sp. NPDC048629 TaxID=3154824 RepID=UPI003431C779